jgi:hypothetical protein
MVWPVECIHHLRHDPTADITKIILKSSFRADEIA